MEGDLRWAAKEKGHNNQLLSADRFCVVFVTSNLPDEKSFLRAYEKAGHKASITPEPARRDESIELDETSRKRAEAAFQRAVDAGELEPPVPVRDLARTLMNTAQGMALMSKIRPEPEMAQSVMRATMATLGVR